LACTTAALHQRCAVDGDFVAELADFFVGHDEDGFVFAQSGLPVTSIGWLSTQGGTVSRARNLKCVSPITSRIESEFGALVKRRFPRAKAMCAMRGDATKLAGAGARPACAIL
jgi:hypothetical protein